LFLDRAKPSYIGGLLEMCNARLYGFWGNLAAGLKTGEAQNEAKRGEDVFAELYADPARLKQFLSAMTGISMGVARFQSCSGDGDPEHQRPLCTRHDARGWSARFRE
jgi:hypothetical protein